MSRLQYREDFMVGCHHHPGGQSNPNPQQSQPVSPASDPDPSRRLLHEAMDLRQQAREAAIGPPEDLSRAAELQRQAEELERQATVILTPLPANPLAPAAVRSNLCGGVIDRDEDLIDHSWYRFLRWFLLIGGISFLGWLAFGGYQWGYHANSCIPPCNQNQQAAQPPNSQQIPASKVQTDTSGLEKQIAELRSTMEKRQTQPVRVIVSPVDLSPIEQGLNRLANALPDQVGQPDNYPPNLKPEPRRTLSDEERAKRSWEAWRALQNTP